MADVLDRVLALAERAVTAGVGPARIVIDPAHDFDKNTWHSLEITRRLGEQQHPLEDIGDHVSVGRAVRPGPRRQRPDVRAH